MRRPHWRKMTWAILIWSGLMAAWLIAGIASVGGHDSYCEAHRTAYLSLRDCETFHSAGEDVGAAVGIAALVVVWFFGFVILSLIWFMTKPHERVVVHEVIREEKA